ncbi:phosphatase PAP2 family protein [Candidatus Saccharibacteria bacterium]|nr:phosphatase PAP2 family protein [Candidatus Saccharibacteria bacterium]
MRQVINRFDQRLTRWVVATFGQSWRLFFASITRLGDPIPIILISAAVIGIGFLAQNAQFALSGIVIPATVLIGALLKILFERARPLTEYAMNMKLKTFSFPSGHSSGSTIAFGVLAILALQYYEAPLGIVLSGALITIPLLVGVSRVYLGAHFPSDVIAGWLLGILALLFVTEVIRPVI